MDSERLRQRIARVETALNQYYEAELAIVGGAQQYSVGSRSLTKANLGDVRQTIREYENLLEDLNSQLNGRGRNRMVGGIPIDS